jgi:thiopurine S-methyltransferase
MDSFFWHKCWARNKLGFHQSDVHPLLSQYFKKLSLPSDQHVFVPLCGKTLDMAYLAQYWQVTGNELSEIACSDFFLENNIEYQKKISGDF